MPGPVDRAFREWTSGLDPTSSRIAIFQHIRDIPYSLNARENAGDSPAERILLAGRGSCGPKHYLLAEMYRLLGLEVAYATFPFLWDDPDLLYPPNLRRLATGLPVAYHLACRVRIDNRWVLVDATWDFKLKKAGFPVNENWDGTSSTKNAVTPIKEIIHDTLEDRVRFAAEHKKSWTQEQARAHEKFPALLNAWLELCRKEDRL